MRLDEPVLVHEIECSTSSGDNLLKGTRVLQISETESPISTFISIGCLSCISVDPNVEWPRETWNTIAGTV